MEMERGAEMNDETAVDEADRALKQKHRAMWASGDYPALASELVNDLGAILVEAAASNRSSVSWTWPPGPVTPPSPQP